jgi:hypothetical protein
VSGAADATALLTALTAQVGEIAESFKDSQRDAKALSLKVEQLTSKVGQRGQGENAWQKDKGNERVCRNCNKPGHLAENCKFEKLKQKKPREEEAEEEP